MSPREALAAATVDGLRLVLPPGLSRPDYVAVNKVLENLGGKWNTRAKAHLFADDPAAAIAAFVNGGAAPQSARTTEGYVPTPDAIGDLLCRYPYANLASLDPGARVLEPSAGDGGLVRAIWRANSNVAVTAVEMSEQRWMRLNDMPAYLPFDARLARFEDFARDRPGQFDAVVMNPPFSVTGNPTIWIDHVRLALGLLAPGGRLVTIVPKSYEYRQDKRHAEIRALVEQFGEADDLPRDAFPVMTMVLTVDRPLFLDWPFEDQPRQASTATPIPSPRPEQTSTSPAVSAGFLSGPYEQASLLELLDA